jgi:hypothetical protein
LFTRCSPPPAGEQPVHINLWAEMKYLLESSQFIERTKRAAESKIDVVRFQDNPRRLGKGRVRLVDPAPHHRAATRDEAEFTGSSGGVRTPSNANEGLGSKQR